MWMFFQNESILDEGRNNITELLWLKMMCYHDNTCEGKFIFHIFQVNSPECRKTANPMHIIIRILILFMKIEEYSWMIL